MTTNDKMSEAAVDPAPAPSSARSRVVMVCAVAAAAAMIAALGFVVRVLMVRHIAGDFVNVSRDYLWMSPLGYLLLFAVPAVPALLLSLVLSERNTARLAVWGFTALVVVDGFMPVTSLGRLSVVILACGVGVLVARNAARASPYVTRGATVIAASIAVGLGVAAALNGRRDSPALTAAPSTSPPNVLLLILDTVRADALGTYGAARPISPRIDAFAKEGVVFESAMSSASWTLPSHASMFTGHYPSNLSADYKVPLDAADSTVAEVLANRGYATAGFVGNVWYTSWESGLTRGFQTFHDYQRSFEQIVKSTHLGRTDLSDELFRSETMHDVLRAIRRLGLQEVPRPQPAPNTAEHVTDTFLRWHGDRDNGRPWFAFLNYFDAHDPYRPLEPWRSRFAQTSGHEQPSARARYEAEVAYIDDHVGRLLDSLARRGELANTLVIITADHGEHFGERNLVGHFNSIYMPLLHVPFILRFDGRMPRGQRVSRPVSLRDLPATIMEAAGGGSPFSGVSLTRSWGPDSAMSSPAASTHALTKGESVRRLSNGMLSLIEGEWHYVLSGLKEHEELYRWRADPEERRNMVGSDSGLALIPGMRSRLYQALEGDSASRRAPGSR